MKKKKKQQRRSRPALRGSAQFPSQEAIRAAMPLPPQAVSLAINLWRVRKAVLEGKADSLPSLVERCEASLKDLGAEIEDPIGTTYREGMTVSVLAFEPTDALPLGVEKIVETISPAVYIANKLAEPAKVIVQSGKGTAHA